MPINFITVTQSDFEPFIGQKFYIQINGHQLELVLDNVKTHENINSRDNHVEIDGVVYPPRQPFALTFEGPRDPIIVSGTYDVMNEEVGKMQLFLSAFRQDHNCVLYEAIFS